MPLKYNAFFSDFFIRYKYESHTTHETMEEFCRRYHIPYADFIRWYKATRPDPSKYTEEEKRERADAVDKILYLSGRIDRIREYNRQAKEKTLQLEEQIKLLQELLESDRRNAEQTDKLSALTEQLRKGNETMAAMAAQISELTRLLKAEREEAARLRRESEARRMQP